MSSPLSQGHEPATPEWPSAVIGRAEVVGARGLVALCNAYRLDGRVSTHPTDVRGWAPMNVYVLRENDHLLVIDGGLTVHRDAILDQLATLVDADTKVVLLPLRSGEFNSICNFGPIAERFNAVRSLGNFFGPPYEWLDFLPGSPGIDALERTDVGPFSPTAITRIDPDSPRALESFVPPVWLIPYPWAYDPESRTLFTQDVFTWVYRDNQDASWVTEGDDGTTVDDVWHSMCHNKYWWLPGSNAELMRRGLAETFERFDVETIAPGYGCVINGRAAVQHHLDLLDQVLERAGRTQSQGQRVATWRHEDVIS